MVRRLLQGLLPNDIDGGYVLVGVNMVWGVLLEAAILGGQNVLSSLPRDDLLHRNVIKLLGLNLTGKVRG